MSYNQGYNCSFNIIILVNMDIAAHNSGGYDYDLVYSVLDGFQCEICHLLSRDPYLSMCCKRLFCKSCLDEHKHSPTTSNVCPVCCDEEFVTFPNEAVNQEIKSLHIYCTNKVIGCQWQGELMNISNHLGNRCQFEEVKCFNECGKMMERQYLTSHVETECPCFKINCQYCHDIGENQFIEGQHNEECPKLPLPCPNKCEAGSVPREDMEAHRKDCPLEMIQCEYYSVGCEARMARKDQEEHKKENMEEHLMKTNLALASTKKELVDVTATLTETLATALQRISTLEALMDSTVTRTTVIESSLAWPLKLAAIPTKSTSGDQACPVILKVSNFNEMKKNDDEWCSDCFYTHHQGYKMYASVYPAGNAISTHLLCFLYLMKGPHDDNLSWPLRDKFEIELLNQIGDNQHHSVTVDYDKDRSCGDRVVEDDEVSGYGKPDFISHKDLYKITTCRYLKDDCVFFRITKL